MHGVHPAGFSRLPSLAGCVVRRQATTFATTLIAGLSMPLSIHTFIKDSVPEVPKPQLAEQCWLTQLGVKRCLFQLPFWMSCFRQLMLHGPAVNTPMAGNCYLGDGKLLFEPVRMARKPGSLFVFRPRRFRLSCLLTRSNPFLAMAILPRQFFPCLPARSVLMVEPHGGSSGTNLRPRWVDRARWTEPVRGGYPIDVSMMH